MTSVLVVDDEATLRTLMIRWLESSGYAVRAAATAEQGLTEMSREPAAVALCDINMPGRDGLWLAGELRRTFPDTAVIMASGAREFSAAVTSLRRGVIDFLVKPLGRDQLCEAVERGVQWHVDAVAARARREELELDLRARHAELTEALTLAPIESSATLEAILRLLTVHDSAAYGHGQRVRELTVKVGNALNLDGNETAAIERGALLHDIGETVIPHVIMYKAASLSDVEQQLVRQHPRLGYEMVKTIPFLKGSAEIVLASHEWFNGGGYPDGLSGQQIPLGARIVAVTDAFDAMTRRGLHQRRLAPRDALRELVRCRGTQFDPFIVDAFLVALGYTANDLPSEPRAH